MWILLPSSWKLILVPVESVGLGDVCARYPPQPFVFRKTNFTSSFTSPIIPTFPLSSESPSARGCLWVWAKCLKAMGSVHWGPRPLGFRCGALLLSFHFCFWTCNSPIICKGLKARESFFSLQRCRGGTLCSMFWYQLAMVEAFNKFLLNMTLWFSSCKEMQPHLQTAVVFMFIFRRHIHLSRKGLTQHCGNCSWSKGGD